MNAVHFRAGLNRKSSRIAKGLAEDAVTTAVTGRATGKGRPGDHITAIIQRSHRGLVLDTADLFVHLELRTYWIAGRVKLLTKNPTATAVCATLIGPDNNETTACKGGNGGVLLVTARGGIDLYLATKRCATGIE